MTDEFRYFGAYRVSKKLGRLYLVVVLLLSIPVFIEHFNAEYHYHLECTEEGQPCINPFYNNCPSQLVGDPICDWETLPAGTSIGDEMLLRSYFGFAVWLLTVMFLVINHLKHNRGVVL